MQVDALTKVGCERVFQEKITGTKLERVQLKEAIDYARADDVISIAGAFSVGFYLKWGFAAFNAGYITRKYYC